MSQYPKAVQFHTDLASLPTTVAPFYPTFSKSTTAAMAKQANAAAAHSDAASTYSYSTTSTSYTDLKAPSSPSAPRKSKSQAVKGWAKQTWHDMAHPPNYREELERQKQFGEGSQLGNTPVGGPYWNVRRTNI